VWYFRFRVQVYVFELWDLGVQGGDAGAELIGFTIAPVPQDLGLSAGQANMAHTRQSRPEWPWRKRPAFLVKSSLFAQKRSAAA
jgi:hypothetical protein